MKVFRQLALESQLEIEKLHEVTQASYSKSEAEVLYDNLKTDKQTQELSHKDSDVKVNQQETSVPEGSDVLSIGSSEELDDQKEEIVPATEELRQLRYVSEDFSENYSTNSQSSSSVGDYLLDAARSIGSLGIEYGPKVASRLYKGVTYVFGKLVKLLAVSTHTLDKYLERRVRSFDNLKSSIQEYRKALKLIDVKTEDDSVHEHKLVYSNVKVINTLKIADSVDFTSNIKVLSSFVNKAVHDISTQVSSDIQAIKHLIAMSESGSLKVPSKFAVVQPVTQGMTKGTIEGYPTASEYTESYIYSETLPSDVVLMAQLPKQDLSDIDDIAKAYSHSSMSLGFDGTQFKEVLTVNYMTVSELTKFLDSLENLVDACIAHQTLYDKTIVSKKNMRFTLRGYFKFLAFSTDKVSLKNSLIEYVYLKSMFIDKVYLVTAMDIHDYSARVVSYGLSFVQDNVKKLS